MMFSISFMLYDDVGCIGVSHILLLLLSSNSEKTLISIDVSIFVKGLFVKHFFSRFEFFFPHLGHIKNDTV
jgi:hypothetical protein